MYFKRWKREVDSAGVVEVDDGGLELNDLPAVDLLFVDDDVELHLDRLLHKLDGVQRYQDVGGVPP